MTVEENYRIKNLELQKKIEMELEYIHQGKSKKNICQLQCILSELKRAEHTYGNTFYFPRFIIDSWDYSDELGVDLMELVDLYKKLK